MIRLKTGLFTSKSREVSLLAQLKSSWNYIKSPMYISYVILFSMGSNCIGLALNMTNDILRNSDLVIQGRKTFGDLQQFFEIVRVTTQIAVCWLAGYVSDVLYARVWKGKPNHDLKQVFLLYQIALIAMVLFSIALTVSNVIMFIVAMPIMTGMVMMYFLTGVAINFPIEAHGVLYGLIELTGSIVAFSQQSLSQHIKGLEDPLPFYTACQWIHTGIALLTMLIGE